MTALLPQPILVQLSVIGPTKPVESVDRHILQFAIDNDLHFLAYRRVALAGN